MKTGADIGNIITKILKGDPQLQHDLIEHLGSKAPLSQKVIMKVNIIRNVVTSYLEKKLGRKIDQEPSTGLYATPLRGKLMQAWAEVAGGPGSRIAAWLFEGAPAGIVNGMSELDGVMPQVDDGEPECSPEDLSTDFDTFVNYKNVDDDPDVRKHLDEFVGKGYLTKLPSLAKVKELLNSEPVLSKLAAIKKTRVDEQGEVVTKLRLILDALRSLVTAATKRTHKSELPSLLDLIFDIMRLMEEAGDGTMVHLMILDIVDAFWLIPLKQNERKYFVFRCAGEYYVYNSTAQGSRGGPLTWAAVMDLTARLVQSTFTDIQGTATEKIIQQPLRLQTYVDDPAMAIMGSDRKVHRHMAQYIVTMLVLGYPLAFHKAQTGKKVKWIGMNVEIIVHDVLVTIPADKIKELKDIVRNMMATNVIPKRDLKSLAGKGAQIASIIFAWRPMVNELYGALKSHGGQQPRNTVWKTQINHTLHWLQAFLHGKVGTIERVFRPAAHFNRTTLIDINPRGG